MNKRSFFRSALILSSISLGNIDSALAQLKEELGACTTLTLAGVDFVTEKDAAHVAFGLKPGVYVGLTPENEKSLFAGVLAIAEGGPLLRDGSNRILGQAEVGFYSGVRVDGRTFGQPGKLYIYLGGHYTSIIGKEVKNPNRVGIQLCLMSRTTETGVGPLVKVGVEFADNMWYPVGSFGLNVKFVKKKR